MKLPGHSYSSELLEMAKEVYQPFFAEPVTDEQAAEYIYRWKSLLGIARRAVQRDLSNQAAREAEQE